MTESASRHRLSLVWVTVLVAHLSGGSAFVTHIGGCYWIRNTAQPVQWGADPAVCHSTGLYMAAEKRRGSRKPARKAPPVGNYVNDGAAGSGGGAEGLGDSENNESSKRGRATFERMEAEERAKEDAKRAEMEAKMRELQASREATKENPDAAVIPEVVANRMLRRMIPFFILPVISGVGLFIFYFVLAKKYEYGFQPAVVAFSTQAPFVVALLGITYAILSSSWDPEVEGSWTGREEFQKNVKNIFDGLRRGSEQQDLEDALKKAEQDAKKSRFERRHPDDDQQ